MKDLENKLGFLRVLGKDKHKNYDVEIHCIRNGVNRNNWDFQNMEECYQTFCGVPILCAYVGNRIGDGHNMAEAYDSTTGEKYFDFTGATAERIVGTLSENPEDIRLEEIDGQTWVVSKGKLWRFYAKQLVDKIAKQGSIEVSAETEIYEEHNNGSTEVYTKWEALGVTILGDGVAPAVPNAHVKALAEMKDEFKKLRVAAANLQDDPEDDDDDVDDDNMDDDSRDDVDDKDDIDDVDDKDDMDDESEKTVEFSKNKSDSKDMQDGKDACGATQDCGCDNSKCDNKEGCNDCGAKGCGCGEQCKDCADKNCGNKAECSKCNGEKCGKKGGCNTDGCNANGKDSCGNQVQKNKGVNCMVLNKKQLAKLQERFDGYKAICAEQNGDNLQVVLMSKDCELYKYTGLASEQTIVPERIERTVAKASVAFADNTVEFDAFEMTDELVAQVISLSAEIKEAKENLQKANDTIVAMQNAENARRLNSAKQIAQDTLKKFNENRENKVDERVLEAINAEVDANKYTAMCNAEGNWIGDKAVETDVLAVCATSVMEMDKKQHDSSKRVNAWDALNQQNVNQNNGGNVQDLLKNWGIQ